MVTVPAVVAELAAPVNAPTNVVLVTLVKPATVVTVAPKVSAVLPSVTELLLNAPLGIEVNPAPEPLNCDPVTVPVALIRPAVRILPPVTLPAALTCVLTVTRPVPLGARAMLAFEAVVCMSNCAESKIAPDNNKLPPVILPVDTVKLVPVRAAPVIAPVALIRPAVKIFAPVTLPLELIAPEFNEVNVPTEVILG